MIGRGEGQSLEPYRIKVMLVENTRINGKVKQKIVAMLGSINATYLESFWEPIPDPAMRNANWERYSLLERTEFWRDVLDRMSKIGNNRLSKDDRVAIRRAIHKVIPWVMEPERKRLELLEARHDFEELKHFQSWTENHIAHDEKEAKKIAERLPELKADSAKWAEKLFHAGLRIAKLQ
jgi:hypothetical protein